jgi:hypothetical protein
MQETGENRPDESRPAEAPSRPAAAGPEHGTSSQVDEHAAMRQEVARQYADALGKRYEPPDEDQPEPPSFERVEIDERKISQYAMNPQHEDGRHKARVIASATGLTQGDSGQIAAQIRAGAQDARPIAGKRDEQGQRWHTDIPLTGPNGTLMVRTAWIMDPGSDRPRMTTISFPPGKHAAEEKP